MTTTTTHTKPWEISKKEKGSKRVDIIKTSKVWKTRGNLTFIKASMMCQALCGSFIYINNLILK